MARNNDAVQADWDYPMNISDSPGIAADDASVHLEGPRVKRLKMENEAFSQEEMQDQTFSNDEHQNEGNCTDRTVESDMTPSPQVPVSEDLSETDGQTMEAEPQAPYPSYYDMLHSRDPRVAIQFYEYMNNLSLRKDGKPIYKPKSVIFLEELFKRIDAAEVEDKENN